MVGEIIVKRREKFVTGKILEENEWMRTRGKGLQEGLVRGCVRQEDQERPKKEEEEEREDGGWECKKYRGRRGERGGRREE